MSRGTETATRRTEPASRGQAARERAVSTVVDVSLCLLLISASVLTIGVYLDADGDEYDPRLADQSAQTIASTTTGIEYSIRAVERNDDTGTFDEPTAYDDEHFRRTTHGSLADLMAGAAVSNVHVDGEQLTHGGEAFAEGVDANVRSELTGAYGNVRVIAVWEPYDDASIGATVAAGERPPPDVDVSSVTMTVPSGFSPVEARDLAGTYDDGSFERTAEPIAESIVEGYFPTRSTTVALQRSDLDRDLVLYRYLRLGSILGVDFDVEDGNLSRTTANVTAANDKLAKNLTGLVASDLEETISPRIETIEERHPTDEDAVERKIDEVLVDAVGTDEVTIVVQTWEP